MPLIVANGIEKCVSSVPQKLVVAAAAVAVDVLPDISTDNAGYIGRYIQNVGANACYYCVGGDASPAQFSGILSASGTLDANGFGPGQQFDASNHPCRISIYSVGGTTIAITLLKRNDPIVGSGGILNQSL